MCELVTPDRQCNSLDCTACAKNLECTCMQIIELLPWEVTVIWLPPPILILRIRPPFPLASSLLYQVGTALFCVVRM